MSLPEHVKRLLWSRSGGYCQNPSCNIDIFVFFRDGAVSSLDELAHIIAEKDKGPRGDPAVAVSARNSFDNILVLCPRCHTLVDKNPNQYSVTALQEWKRKHEERVHDLFRAPKLASRADMRPLLRARLRENKAIYDAYGPFSPDALTLGYSDTAEQWVRRARGTIVPNNRFVLELLRRNDDLLTDPERVVVDAFAIHQEAFEYNTLSGNKMSSPPLFPPAVNNLLEND